MWVQRGMMLALNAVEKTREDIQYICENRRDHFVHNMLKQAAEINYDYIRDLSRECKRIENAAEKAATKNKKGGGRSTRRRKTQRKNRNAK